MKFALIGLGFIAQRHLDSIKDVGGEVLVVCDIDRKKQMKVPEAQFYTDWRKILKSEVFKEVSHISILTPNHLHYQMALECARMGKQVLVEKPLAINARQTIWLQSFDNIFTVLQLRHNPEIRQFRETLNSIVFSRGEMKIRIHRDMPYFKSWKAKTRYSGGLATNIGIHYFDLLQWFFGQEISKTWTVQNQGEMKGALRFKNALVDWELSIYEDLDKQVRHLRLNDSLIDLSRNFENLHTEVYKEFIQGRGIKPSDVLNSIRLTEQMR